MARKNRGAKNKDEERMFFFSEKIGDDDEMEIGAQHRQKKLFRNSSPRASS